ncbi:Cytidyltransferase-like domain [uncultured Caudovirales phage]|uniref:Cytidyltransferase-like domain n=1 Tax=uncultured Caudovirales phage TaxID=2100421 RepID=A0A6J5TD37_9CAUD|nr:Cytidyltransferase-like domain [uncultured Caudovirales phage]
MNKQQIKTVVVLSGGFDPIHGGHIAMIKAARELGEYLVIGLNSDTWLTRKKGAAFMPWHHRAEVLRAITGVDEVMSWDDYDDTACQLLDRVKREFSGATVVFANGGDRTAVNIPEMSVKDVIFKFGIGGDDKRGSSSDFLKEWKQPKTLRPWGDYRVLYDEEGTKVKELVVQPGQSLSLQRHKNRNEFWHVVEGRCNVVLTMSSGYAMPPRTLTVHDRVDIMANEWHRLHNPYNTPCKIVEIQFGTECVEEDIERKSY